MQGFSEKDDLKELFGQVLNRDLLQIILSNTRNAERAVKAKIRPVLIKDELMFQETLYRGTQVFHSNFSAREMA